VRVRKFDGAQQKGGPSPSSKGLFNRTICKFGSNTPLVSICFVPSGYVGEKLKRANLPALPLLLPPHTLSGFDIIPHSKLQIEIRDLRQAVSGQLRSLPAGQCRWDL